MQNYEFVVWLEGYLELCEGDEMTVHKLYILQNHLNLVKAVTGEIGPLNTEIYQVISSCLNGDRSEEKLAEANVTIRKLITEFLSDTFDSKE